MNPSAAELLEAVERVPADQVVVLPNNSNIVAVARTLDGQSAKRVVVVPTTSVPEGFASLLGYDPESDAASNAESMAEIAKGVVVGEVTRAVRAATTSVGEVATGDWVGLDRIGICSIADAPSTAATALLDTLVDRDHEILTVIVGEGVRDVETRAITEWIAENRPNIETEIHQGGQGHSPYLFGVE
jgi:dihydroxyacetone kinase-like predicted kinase